MKYDYQKYMKYRVELVKEEEGFFGHKYMMQNPEDAHKFLIDVCGLHKYAQEVFLAVALDIKLNIIGYSVISMGDLCSSLVHPREVFKFLISCNAAYTVIAHNHPSGICTPSRNDLAMTQRLKAAGELLGINIEDHIIVGDENHYCGIISEKHL